MTPPRRPRSSRTTAIAGTALALGVTLFGGCTPQHLLEPAMPTGIPAPTPTGRDPGPLEPTSPPPSMSTYPWHTDIVATTFWVGEVFDADADDGSQEVSTYDSDWIGSYGGCDGVVVDGVCETEVRVAARNWFPSSMSPHENPFYLDLPYDDVNDPVGFALRDSVLPWAGEEPYASHVGDRSFSYLKNRWVELVYGDRRCFGQVEDAGPGEYRDAAYVFGADDARPANSRYGGAGLDVSPALTGCLGFPELDGVTRGVSWRFVDDDDVPQGPWTIVVTTSQVR